MITFPVHIIQLQSVYFRLKIKRSLFNELSFTILELYYRTFKGICGNPILSPQIQADPTARVCKYGRVPIHYVYKTSYPEFELRNVSYGPSLFYSASRLSFNYYHNRKKLL